MVHPSLPLVIVPCGGAKLATSAPAGDMYIGGYHRACRRAAAAMATPTNTLILSAPYGLLPLQRVIGPYDLRMGQPGSITSAALRDQARRLGAAPHDQVIVLGGRAYTSAALAIWPAAATPLAGLQGMGYQLQALSQLARQPCLLAEGLRPRRIRGD